MGEDRNQNDQSNKTDVKVAEEIGDLKLQLSDLKLKYSDVTRVKGAEGAVVFNSENTNASRTIQLEVSEQMEREKRKNNLVIFGIEETNDENITKSKINDIMNVIAVDTSKVKYFGRVGRTVTAGRPRVVRVVCEDAEVRRKILKESNKLRGASGLERTYISPDLTKNQQELDKALREKLKTIRVQYKEAKISNGEIIVVESGNRKVLHPRQEN